MFEAAGYRHEFCQFPLQRQVYQWMQDDGGYRESAPAGFHPAVPVRGNILPYRILSGREAASACIPAGVSDCIG